MRAELQEIVDEFAESPTSLRLPLLLEFADGLVPIPERIDASQFEQVHECQTPFFSAIEVDGDGRVTLHFQAPAEAPTTRGYAGVLQQGLNGATTDEVLETPADFFVGMQLNELISPLRLRGMGAILARVKRQIVEHQSS
ncbi:MAG TPA: SufE family protein [Miltoncostaeales bacterium]|nr:SufE family protein [Miltoncostaeales bacterium]